MKAREGQPNSTRFPSNERSATVTAQTQPGSISRILFLSGLLVLAVLCSAGLVASQPAAAAFSVEGFDGMVTEADGSAATQAGSHPYEGWTDISFGGEEEVREVVVDLPPGFGGDPFAVPKCSREDYAQNACSNSSKVGVATVYFAVGSPALTYPIWNLEPNDGKPAEFGFNPLLVPVILSASVRTEGDYGLTITAPGLPQSAHAIGTAITFWGVPADESHDALRGFSGCLGDSLDPAFDPSTCGPPASSDAEELPLLTNPTDCAAGPARTYARAASWQHPTLFSSFSFLSHTAPPESKPVGVEGCENVPFEPTFTAQPTTNQAASPTGLDVHLSIPQEGLREPDALASAHLKKAEVTLPAGMLINASSADGLGACSPDQIGLTTPVGQSPSHFSADPANCPGSSKIGEVEIDTPVLDHTLKGSVYLASQGTNPFNSTLALYLAVADKKSGVVVKLPGKVSPDPSTGQLTAVFDNNPQLPFSDLHLQFKGGPAAPLMTPATCGTHSTQSTLTSWAGGSAVQSQSSFKLTAGPGGSPCPSNQFAPKFEAGTQSPLAGTFSPFVLRFSRADGTQEVSGVASATLPPGLTGKLAGIPYCPDAALAGIGTAPGTGAAQVDSPSCPAASQIGVVTAGAGAGPNPFYVKTGRAYLAGPYQGAPLSMAIVTPAVAGPFDLGNVVVRTALNVNPESAQISAGAVNLPRFLEGIPLDLRSVEVDLDRPSFTINPTNCEPMAVSAVLTGVDGASANVSSRFQAGSCVNLGFAPKLALSLKGGTKRGTYPQLRAVLQAPPGQANIAKVSVALPHSAFLAQEHINTICTRVQFSARACPAGSVYGHATAWSPLLDQPLSGPVYLRSSTNKLPDLVVSLDGQVHIDLVGRIDSVDGGIRNSFEAVPDAPVSKFVLEMKGGKKGLLVNSRNICRVTSRATVQMDGQNGKLHDFRPVLKNGCKKQAKGKGKPQKSKKS